MKALRFKQLPHGADLPLPTYATEGAAGLDICSAVSMTLAPGATRTISTGFAIAVPDGWEVQARTRSGMAARQSVHVLNSPGTIDSDYRGEIKVILHNAGFSRYVIQRGDRIAQLVPKQAPRLSVMLVADLDETERGDGGFGSTGK